MTSEFGLDRRAWIRRVLQVAAGASLAASTGAAATDWTPQVLTPAQNQALIAMGERIVPGSAAALCNRIIDLVLTLESEQTRAQLTGALAAFAGDADGSALTQASVSGSARHPQFLIIKEWIADTYWSSEPGLRELGWTGKMAWPSFPGCEMPGETARKI
jgi:hypothetical protein